jgi:CTD kinase subunit beta
VTGPHPSYIQVAKPYVFQQQLQGQLVAMGANPLREDTFRLQGVQWINDVRIALQLPVRTFCTACVYYHKFRLVHKDNEYQFQDAAAAALLTACKIEDTLKKSKEILCAAHNVKVGIAEHLSPDDNVGITPIFEDLGANRCLGI